MVVTLGTGGGTAIFARRQDRSRISNCRITRSATSKTYDEYVGRAALDKIGKKKWNRRVARVIDVLRTVVAFDHLYIGGGNAKHLKIELPHDVSIVPNSSGLIGGFALWREHRCGAGWRKTPTLPGHSRDARPPQRRGPRSGSTCPRAPATAMCTSSAPAASFRSPTRGYTPPPASADELSALLQALHLSRVVIVQPSVYGSDNSCTLDGMRRLGRPRPRRRGDRRATSDAELDDDAPGRHPRRAGSISKPPARATPIWRGVTWPTRWRGSRRGAGMSRSIRGCR